MLFMVNIKNSLWTYHSPATINAMQLGGHTGSHAALSQKEVVGVFALRIPGYLVSQKMGDFIVIQW
jgi:hypothetical protein